MTRASVSTLYAGHGVGVIATYDPSTGCGRVFASTNLRSWRNITPPLKRRAGIAPGQCTYTWTGAYFTSPRVGWLLGRNGGSTETILRHTVNGGRTWTAQPGGSTGSNAGNEAINFVNATIGWRQQFGIGSNGNYSLQRTLDGGASWTTLSPYPRGLCIAFHEVFASSRVGFASVTPGTATNPTHLWRTTDGGVKWSPISLPRPPAIPSGTLGLYGTPIFSGRTGVVPVDYPFRDRQAIYFYVTHDGGMRWSRVATTTRVIVAGALYINRQSAATDPCFGSSSTPVATGDVAIIAPADPTTWWILQPGGKANGSISVASPSSGRVSSARLRSLPSTRKVTTLAALNSRRSLLTLPIPYGYQSTYETADGGSSWVKVSALALPHR